MQDIVLRRGGLFGTKVKARVASGFWSLQEPIAVGRAARALAAEWFESNRPVIEARIRGRYWRVGADELEERLAEALACCWVYALRRACGGGREALGALTARQAQLAACSMYARGYRVAGGRWRSLVSLDEEIGTAGGDDGDGLACLGDDLAAPRHYDPFEMTRVRLDCALAAGRMEPRERRLFLHLAENPADREMGAERLARSLGIGCVHTIEGVLRRIHSVMEGVGYDAPGRRMAWNRHVRTQKGQWSRWRAFHVYSREGFYWWVRRVN